MKNVRLFWFFPCFPPQDAWCEEDVGSPASIWLEHTPTFRYLHIRVFFLHFFAYACFCRSLLSRFQLFDTIVSLLIWYAFPEEEEEEEEEEEHE